MTWPDYMSQAIPVLIAVLTVTWAAIGALAGYAVAQARTLGRVAESVAAIAAVVERIERHWPSAAWGACPKLKKEERDDG